MPRKPKAATTPGHGGHRNLFEARIIEKLVLKLRADGHTFDEIAAYRPTVDDHEIFKNRRRALFADHSAASKAYHRALDRITASDAREAFERDVYRIEQVIDAHLPEAIAGSQDSANVALRAMRDRARMFGYASTVSGSLPEAVQQLVDSITALQEADSG